MDGTNDLRTARRARLGWRRLSWRRLLLAAGLGLGVALTSDGMLDEGAGATARAAPAPAPTSATVDLRVSLAGSDWRVAPNEGFSYRVTVSNRGGAATPAHVETLLHPALGNVTVSSPGFSCARRFAASGERRGTSVACTTWEPIPPGASATFTVQARAGSTPGTYEVAATVAPRDGEDVAGTSIELRVAA